jgi:hypothetical protein
MDWLGFIQEPDGKPSATRLNMVIGVLVGSFVVVWLTVKGSLGGEIFAAYLLATGGVYGVGKWRDSTERVEQIKADSPNNPPAQKAPPKLGPTTVIQVGTDGQEAPREGKKRKR